MNNPEQNPKNDIDFIINPEAEETKELTNRQLQFFRLTKASEAARKIKEQLVKEAPTEAKALFLATRPLNYFILNFVYRTNGITDFKKFNEWKQEGATVKKGEKAYPIWGQPVGKQKEDEAKSKGENYTASEEENERYPLCYVFSNLQVRAIERKEAVC
jgi:hypothetical protein